MKVILHTWIHTNTSFSMGWVIWYDASAYARVCLRVGGVVSRNKWGALLVPVRSSAATSQLRPFATLAHALTRTIHTLNTATYVLKE